MKIQIVSDIHLEFRGYNFQKILKQSAPILFLLGDICACGTEEDFDIYKKFMTFLAPKYDYIFHVPGNHEYYTAGNTNIGLTDTIPGIDNKIRKFLKSFKNVFFLNNDTVRLKIGRKNYVFVGSTLWTDVKLENRKKIETMMNDYDNIYVPNVRLKSDIENNGITLAESNRQPVRKYTIDDMTKNHIKAVKYIKKEMKTIQPGEIAILLTHHKPVRDDPLSNIISQAYESDLKDIIICPPFKVACHGHTHVKYDKVISKVRVLSNPKGYISQKTNFDDAFVFDI